MSRRGLHLAPNRLALLRLLGLIALIIVGSGLLLFAFLLPTPVSQTLMDLATWLQPYGTVIVVAAPGFLIFIGGLWGIVKMQRVQSATFATYLPPITVSLHVDLENSAEFSNHWSTFWKFAQQQ